MESKENKQKTQAAEEQVSCQPQQSMEPITDFTHIRLFFSCLFIVW